MMSAEVDHAPVPDSGRRGHSGPGRLPAEAVRLRSALAAACAVASTALGLIAQPAEAAPAAAHSGWTGNLISYQDSDFEGGVGDWVNYSGSALSDDTDQAFLHQDSLRAVAAGTTQAFKLAPGAGQIGVTGGDLYRVGAWFKAPARTGRAVTFAAGFFSRSGTWLGWSSGAPVSLNGSGRWQYASAVIQAPARAGYADGSPRVTETGTTSGEALNMDEVQFTPYRAATLIGAEDTSGNCGAFSSANAAIGPLQSCKVFYSAATALPPSYAASVCAGLPAGVTCLISYKVQTTNVASFVGSIPPGKNVILTYWQEPENDTFSSCAGQNRGSSGANYVCQFQAQSRLVRASTTAANRANVFVAMDAMDYQYAAGTGHNDGGAPSACSFIPPAASTDMYLVDHYEFTASGKSLAADPGSSAEWAGWLGCVARQGKPIGLAEYGLNCGQAGGRGAQPDAPTTSKGISADSSYLAGEPDGLPVLLWEYWWDANAGCQFSGGQAVSQWRAAESQNGGGGAGA